MTRVTSQTYRFVMSLWAIKNVDDWLVEFLEIELKHLGIISGFLRKNSRCEAQSKLKSQSQTHNRGNNNWKGLDILMSSDFCVFEPT